MLIACGANEHSQLSTLSNNSDVNGMPAVNPPVQLDLDTSQISSFSSYDSRCVVITNNGKAFGSGDNTNYKLSSSLSSSDVTPFTQIELHDKNDKKCQAVSAVCCDKFTVYLIQSSESGDNQLAIACDQIESGYPAVIDTGSSTPVALFGGDTYAAVIDDEGSVLFVPESVGKSLEKTLKRWRLPDGEVAVSVACCIDFVYVLSAGGKVFVSPTNFQNIVFSAVSELRNVVIDQISGTFMHCFAISKDGRVARGQNGYKCLGTGNVGDYFGKFTAISSLDGKKITQASAGMSHSLFLAEDGKVFACGGNHYGQLPIGECPCSNAISITEAAIDGKASFCVAGNATSFIFVDCDAPKSPNRRTNGKIVIKQKKVTPSTKRKVVNKSMVTNDENAKLLESGSKEMESIKKAFDEMKKENEILKKERDSLKNENENVTKERDSLMNENKKLKKTIMSLKKRLYNLQQTSEKQQQQEEENQVNDSMTILSADSVESMKKLCSLGRGGQSEVFKVARDEVLALKVLVEKIPSIKSNLDKNESEAKNVQASPSSMKRLMTEYELLNNLHHRNIIRAYGLFFGSKSHPPCILLELCAHSLTDLVGVLTDVERVTIIYELSLALREVHSRGIIHRDVKPENVLLDASKHVKLSDFGVSCLVDVTTQTQSLTTGVGTIKFMSPELLSESTKYDSKVDVYSFGIVVFYVLTGGHLPQMSIADVVLGKLVKVPKSVNSISRDLISRCLSFNPEHRPTMAEVVNLIKEKEFKLIDGVEDNVNEIHKFIGL